MAEKEVIFKSEERKSRAEVVEFLRELAERLKEGRLVFKKGEEEVVVEVPEEVVLELKAERKQKPGKTKGSFEVEIEWGEGGEKVELV